MEVACLNPLCRPSSKRWEEAKNEGGAHSEGHYKYNRRKSFSKEFWTLSDYGSTVEAVGWVCEYIIKGGNMVDPAIYTNNDNDCTC